MYLPTEMTEEDIKQALSSMDQDASLNTLPGYVRTPPDSIELMPFQELHLAYLMGHPKINAANYLTNLRVMIKQRI
jgi:hypothetical protein